jgi:hypothetical protein
LNCGFQNKVSASKSPTFFSRKPLAPMVLRQKSKSQILDFLGGKSNVNFVFCCYLNRQFLSASHLDSL